MKLTYGKFRLGILMSVIGALEGCGSDGQVTREQIAQSLANKQQIEQATPTQIFPILEPTLSSITTNIFTPKCMRCHNMETKTPITNFNFLIVNSWAVPGDLQKSLVYQKIQLGGGMPPTGPLTDLEIKAIGDWITAGALND